MMHKISSTLILIASMVLISSAYKFSPPKNYTWPQNTSMLCFAARFDLVLNVQYLQTNGAKATANIPLNDKTYETYRVSCATETNVHELTISMLSGLTDIFLQFTVDDTNTTSLTKVYGYVTVNDRQSYFKDYAASVEGVHKFSSNESLFTTARAKSYRCNTKTAIKGFTTDNNVTVTSIDLENLRIQPFVDDSKDFKDFGEENVCSSDVDKNSNLIPIIVGACLAVLVVIVLVAYLIGRRRSRNGYQSV